MALMRPTLVIAMGFLASGMHPAAAQIYRCTGPSGAVAYQEVPCEAGANERPVKVQEFPPVNSAERDRLMERDAALDARLLKRAEIDAAERMAKEARWAKEAELEAERQRAKNEAQYYPAYPVYGGPVRPRPFYRPGTSALRY